LQNLLRSNLLQDIDVNFNEKIPTLLNKIRENKIRFFNEDIDKFLGLKQLHYLPYNYQKAGNCAWLAAKMSFKASLLLFHLQKKPALEMDTILKQVKALYSDWLNFDYARGLSALPKAIEEPLVRSNIDFNAVYSTLLTRHFKGKRIALLEVLFQQRPELIQRREQNGVTLLHYANDAKIAALLIQKGAQTDALDIYGNTPLHWLCVRPPDDNTNMDIAKVLLAHMTAAQTNTKNQAGYTSLHCLPENGVEMAKLLIDNGADIGIKNVKGEIAAVIAAHPELAGGLHHSSYSAKRTNPFVERSLSESQRKRQRLV
jgi:hypothetical protein